MNVSRSCWKLTRTAATHLYKAQQYQPHRSMAITATVKNGVDTSALEFPAPSSVTLSTQLAEIAENISDFYSNPESTINLPEPLQTELKDELDRKVTAMSTEIDTDNTDAAVTHVPESIKLGDSPLFDTYKQSRSN